MIKDNLLALQEDKVLMHYLMNDVEELEEGGGKAAGLRGVGQIAAVAEAVAKRHPLLLHQHSEPVQCAVVRVQAELCDCRDLQQ